jgi:hypothetical protein
VDNNARGALRRAAEALREADRLIKVCRDNPRAEDEDRIVELEEKVAEFHAWRAKWIRADRDLIAKAVRCQFIGASEDVVQSVVDHATGVKS